MRCATCRGTGSALVRRYADEALVIVARAPCPDCGGSGIAYCCEGESYQPPMRPEAMIAPLTGRPPLRLIQSADVVARGTRRTIESLSAPPDYYCPSAPLLPLWRLVLMLAVSLGLWAGLVCGVWGVWGVIAAIYAAAP